MRLDRHSLASFLDKIAGNYPSGLPLTALVFDRGAPEKTPEDAPTRECLFVLISTDSSISSTHADLIDAICTKGLKFERSACDVRVMPTWRGIDLGELPPLTVVLGTEIAPGSIEETSHGKTLFSHPIGSIATSAGLKRDFWGHLQTLQRG
jgi:hypothetical protein